MDLQPLNEREDDEPRHSEFSRRKADLQRINKSGWAIARGILWLLLYATYLSLAISGVYLLKTYELPGDHRYKKDVESAIASPRREGYGTGGELTDLSRSLLYVFLIFAEKIFIAAMFRDNEAVLPYWIREMTKFIYYAGPVR
jgi:hypothetical protein